MGGGLMGRARLCPEFPLRSAALRPTLDEAADHPAGLPLIGVAAAALALGEPLGAREALALGLTLAGVTLAPRKA